MGIKLNPVNTVPTPTQEVLGQSMQEIIVSDVRGRKIGLRKPSVLAQYRLIGMLGNDLASNQPYVGMCLPMLYIGSIDGDAVLEPSTHRQLEALIQRLDEDGIAAVTKGVLDHFGNRNPEEDKAQLRK